MPRVTELIWRSNNKSVIRGLDEIANKSERTSKTITRENETASASFHRMGESAERTRSHIGGLAAIVGLGGLGLGIKDAVNAGTQWQAQQAQLQVALKNTGNRSAETRTKILDAAEALSTKGGFGASETLQGMTQFVRVSGSANDAISKTALATNIARSSGRDFNQVLRALLLAEQGRTTGLARLGVAIPKVTTAQDALRNAAFAHKVSVEQLTAAGYKLTAQQKAQLALHQQITPEMLRQAKAQDALASSRNVFSLLQGKYGGATQAFSGTTAGRISNARNAIDIALKTTSQKLLPVVAKIVTVGSGLILFLVNHKAALVGLGVAIGSVVTILTAHKVIMEVLRAKTYALTFAQQLLGISTRTAAAGTETLGATAATTAPEVARLGVASEGSAGKMGILSGGLTGLAAALGPVLAALAAYELGKTAVHDIKDTVRDFKHGGLHHVAQQSIHRSISGGNSLGIPSIIHQNTGNPINNAVNAFFGVGGHKGGLLHAFNLFHASGGVIGGPRGTDTVPAWMTPGEGVVTAGAGMAAIGGPAGLAAINSGRLPFHFTITPGVTVLKVDARVLARAVTEYSLQRGAHGASSLVGGALATH